MFSGLSVLVRVLLLALALAAVAPLSHAEHIWDLEAVDSNGAGTHPKVGAPPGADPANSPNRVVISGIALNSPAELVDTSMQWQAYVQGESPGNGGIAAWAGIFYNPAWPRFPSDILPGDRIQIDGFIEDHNGKVNITERHSAAPGMQFTVTKLASGAGMPAPETIPCVAACNFFDQTRATGGEKYQARWCKLSNARIVSGEWGAGNSIVITDDNVATMTLLLSSQGDFNSHSAPAETFSVTGIFDQEDTEFPCTSAYRLWVRKYSDINLAPASARDWECYE